MKRYKQIILSHFFVTEDGSGIRHLVEANLDIESRSDRTLCTEVLHSDCRYEVLSNQHISRVCIICAAILDRRISNMPVERKANVSKNEMTEVSALPDSQLSLLSIAGLFGNDDDPGMVIAIEKQPEQIELFF